MINFDDKDLAIITIGLIAIVAIVCYAVQPFDVNVESVVSHTVTAIAGVATGKALTKTNGDG